ncbi:MAG: heat-inducible transcriptional repressor HrcA [Holosporales bacterium]|jgi:heat-inducible transcriptional repressor|nr:heat-inducible transcriptional repressor HrcA [Holosporales bacterium]
MGEKAQFPSLSERSLEVFRELVDTYIETGEAVGSRLLSKRSTIPRSSATIRNIMADLEDIGLLYAPHTSAGRIPTESGLRFFVNELLEVSNFDYFENETISNLINKTGGKVETNEILEKVSSLLSGLAQCAGVVSCPKTNPLIRKIDFVQLGKEQLLVIIVSESGQVENRLVQVPHGIDQSVLESLTNYASSRLCGRVLSDGIATIESELREHRGDCEQISDVLRPGLEALKTDSQDQESIFLNGRANLLNKVEEMEELCDVRNLFEIMETKSTMLNLLNSVASADGIQVFIGSENPYFKVSGCALVLAPYKTPDNHCIGALGVIGPTNMKYREVIPLVNYTSKIISKILRTR